MPTGTVRIANRNVVLTLSRKSCDVRTSCTGRSRRRCSAAPGTAGCGRSRGTRCAPAARRRTRRRSSERRDQQQVAEPALAPADALARPGVTRDAPRWPRSVADPRRRTRDRTRAARRRRRRGTWCSPPAGAGLVRVLAHDHELLVGEAAHDVALVPERLDHAHRRRDALARRRSAGLRAARRSRPRRARWPRPRVASSAVERARCRPGAARPGVAVDAVDAAGRRCSSAGCR